MDKNDSDIMESKVFYIILVTCLSIMIAAYVFAF